MARIQVLDQQTINQIAAGEVVERPASVVKELVENAIDAGAAAIRVELRDGGLSAIRITDNGCGIWPDDVATAFLPHATSKISTVSDLDRITSLGFRGEALSSIAAVSQVEIVTKRREEELGLRYCIEGGVQKTWERTGAPDGTMITVRNLFLNVPARRKFMRTPMTEASHVQEAVTHLALAHPEIAFSFCVNGQDKFQTSGNGKDTDVVYTIYGRETAKEVRPVSFENDFMTITGLIGNPILGRGNRSMEHTDLNGRYFVGKTISKAAEDAYATSLMQHKFPFLDLHLQMCPELADVNIHPAKMEVKFRNQQQVYDAVYTMIRESLHRTESIPSLLSDKDCKEAGKDALQKTETVRDETVKEAPPEYEADDRPVAGGYTRQYFLDEMRKRVAAYHADEPKSDGAGNVSEDRLSDVPVPEDRLPDVPVPEDRLPDVPVPEDTEQISLLSGEDRILTGEHRREFRIIGQAFLTYWIIEWKETLLILDQHAAHERVLYEKVCEELRSHPLDSQMISPPLILRLSLREQELLKEHEAAFKRLGFEIEEFGDDSFALSGVPAELEGIGRQEIIEALFESLENDAIRLRPGESVELRLATMACKAAVKGNQRLSVQEMETLLDQLLGLENPYHCPHGRPTMIALTQKDLEKRFKRVL